MADKIDKKELEVLEKHFENLLQDFRSDIKFFLLETEINALCTFKFIIKYFF